MLSTIFSSVFISIALVDSSNTKILEFRTKETGKILENIALTNKLNFHTLEVVPKEFASQQHGLIEVSIEELRKIILDF